MRKKIIIGSVILAFMLSVGYLVAGVINKMHYTDIIRKRISTLPEFSFKTLNNNIFSSSDIKDGPVLIVRFHPECEHCQYEISELLQSSIPDSDANVILISSAPVDTVRNFLARFDIDEYPSVIPLIDTSYMFDEVFGSSIVPSNYIYNSKHELVNAIQGEVKTGTIVKYLLSVEED